MPVYIGDVLESAGGPVLDLSTRQVKGIGFFSDTDQRDDLPSDLKTEGYISVTDEKLEIFRPWIGSPIDTQWGISLRWKNVLVNKGVVIDLAYNENGQRDYSNDLGALLGSGNPNLIESQYPFKAGDVFHIRGIDKGINAVQPFSDRHMGAITDGSYLCIEDVLVPVAPDGNDGQIKAVIEVIHDEIVGGAIVPFHPSRTSVSRHLNLTDNNIANFTAYDNLAEALLTNDNGKILIGFDNYESQAAQDFSLTFSDIISVIATGIAEDLVTNGYGDYTSYGGVAGNTYSAGDINQDGLVTVADLIILLGGFGTAPEPTFNPTIVSFTNVYGDGFFGTSNPFDEDLYAEVGAEAGSGTNHVFMYKDWGTYGLPPTVSQGGATVHIVNANNSTTSLQSLASPPGDMVIFSETPSNDFYINSFGSVQANQARIEIRENDGDGLDNDSVDQYRNLIMITGGQQNIPNLQLQLVARVRRFYSASSLPDITQNVIDENEIILHDSVPPQSGNAIFYNLTTGSGQLDGTGTISISDLYESQVGNLIFQNSEDSEGNELNVKAVGIQVGYKFLGTLAGTNMNHPNVHITNFDLICRPPIG